MRGLHGRASLLPTLALLVLGAGCGARPPVTGGAEPLLEAARNEGVELEDPMALDPGTVASVRAAVGGRGEPLDRLRRLDEHLRSGDDGFAYVRGTPLDAQSAFDERRGDCLAYAMLFGALARGLGVPIHFVHASEVRMRYERAGSFYASSHVAVGYGTGPSAVVIDFSEGKVSDWHLTPYEPIPDATLVALHYNNVAVKTMTDGRLGDAERLFAALVAVEHRVPELFNNYGVLLNRRGRHQQALQVLSAALRRFPEYSPLYTNVIHAAQSAGNTALAAAYEERGRRVADRDPFFLFARGMFLYKKRSYDYAADQFARARGAQPDSPVIAAWLTRAYFAAGEHDRAREAFVETRRLDPGGRLARDLAAQYPDLAAER